jgi:hypothetical protein
MKTINSDHLKFRGHMPPCFAIATVEASEIGLRPGQWPRATAVEGAVIGNEQPFDAECVQEDYAVYRQRFGTLKIHVVND